MKIIDCLKMMREKNASDIFFRAGGPVRMRIDGKIIAVTDLELSVEDVMHASEELT